MMVLSFGLFAVGSYTLLRRWSWGWWLVMAALVVGTIVFIRDVDWSQPLGLQF
jgi:hypothetical protein